MDRSTEKKKNTIWKSVLFVSVLMAVLILAVLFAGKNERKESAGQEETQETDAEYQESSQENSNSGQIFLYGEQHSKHSILKAELDLWEEYYNNQGMRHLFVEVPYYTAEFFNLWMQSEDDAILEQIYKDIEGTAMHSQEVWDFYKTIKERTPETIFHGTDVGHQFSTTGERYLKYLKDTGKEESWEYTLTQEIMEQGETYYKNQDDVYREYKMAENFKREFDRLDGESVMGIYGAAHIDIHGLDYKTNSVPCMANQLAQFYGERLHSEDLTYLLSTGELQTISIQGTEYEAVYFGKQDISSLAEYQYREFWRISDAYDTFKECPITQDILPYDNYPVQVETGQVFVIDYTKKDGSVVRKYYRSDGKNWNGKPVTEEFTID